MAKHGSRYPAEVWSHNLFRFPDLMFNPSHGNPKKTLPASYANAERSCGSEFIWVKFQNTHFINICKIKPATIGILTVYNESFQWGKTTYLSKPFGFRDSTEWTNPHLNQQHLGECALCTYAARVRWKQKKPSKKCNTVALKHSLVGGFNPVEKY